PPRSPPRSCHGDRGRPLFFPAVRECRRDAASVAARAAGVGAHLSLPCLVLFAYGAARRGARDDRARAVDHVRRGTERRALARSGAARILPRRPALGDRRGRMSQSRRLAAILAADVAGYSRLMGADEEGTLERLKALRRELVDPKIAEHHGRIVKTTGDGLLVEFGSVVDALRYAVEVQREMARRNTGVLS